jgi:hypothetical protein
MSAAARIPPARPSTVVVPPRKPLGAWGRTSWPVGQAGQNSWGVSRAMYGFRYNATRDGYLVEEESMRLNHRIFRIIGEG